MAPLDTMCDDSDSDDDDDFGEPSGLSQSSSTTTATSPAAQKKQAPATPPVMASTPDQQVDKEKLRQRAQRVIEKAVVPEEITSTDQLRWHRYKSKRKTPLVLPVLVCAKDSIIGLNVSQDFDETKRTAIEYLSYLKGGKRSVVLKSQLLVPCDDAEGCWQEEYMKDYLDYLRKDRKSSYFELCKEELYLKRILTTVREREKKNNRATVAPLVKTTTYAEVVATERVSSVAAAYSIDRTKEPLRAGDVIEYTQTIYRAGDKRGLTQAVVLSVTGGNPILELHNHEVLPENHLVKRIRMRRRGKLVMNDKAAHKPIRSYKLVKSQVEEAYRKELEERKNKQILDVVDQAMETFQKNLENDGLGNLMGMVNNNTKSSSRKRKADENNKPDNSKRLKKEGERRKDADVETLQRQLTNLEQQTGRRRRAAGVHMTKDMLEVALQVHERDNWSIESLAKELDDDIGEYGLGYFLKGDEQKMIRLVQHEEIAEALRTWLEKNPVEPTSSGIDSSSAVRETATEQATVVPEDEHNAKTKNEQVRDEISGKAEKSGQPMDLCL